MERLPKIILMIVAMTAIFLWVSTAFNSCGDKDIIADDDVELVSSDDEDFTEFNDDPGEGIFGDDGSDNNDFLFSNDDDDEEYVEEEADVDFTEPAEERSTSYTRPRATATSSSGAGEYMVIAGNYLVEANARDMIAKLRNLGYDNAEIGIFQRSQYHTVIASRHASQSSAFSVANDIKHRGVDCYVKKKTY